ncbi:1-acyl-sn-glycerol-3-phosphate acyltransferase [Sphingomonas sp. R647]|uniref:lysophospholipid acyltransferase family protein n=1 Tax=Sphingomonas sp. R647 TaxID=2875233 RepID=UPI001CD57445|nr:lysophospholipid acyltransferase family protein [Sphingomonas sp. R647]MCA1198661.1 1-acyl-sn-glycerol-3-phosphate acyltransferase [Sphingomonas sp. R647]
MADRIRTLIFSIIFYGLSVPIVLAAPIIALFGTQRIRRYSMAWAGLGLLLAHQILGIRVAVAGQRAEGPALYAVKHQAMYETLAMAAMLDAPAIVMKQELARIPVWGWVARQYGVIVIDRAGSAKALRAMMKEARAAVAEGRSVVIFPEGTRTPPGETPPLRSGFAGLYRAIKLPVIPVACETGKVWPRQGPKRPGTVTFLYGDPLPPGLPREEIEAAVHRRINAFEPGFSD